MLKLSVTFKGQLSSCVVTINTLCAQKNIPLFSCITSRKVSEIFDKKNLDSITETVLILCVWNNLSTMLNILWWQQFKVKM